MNLNMMSNNMISNNMNQMMPNNHIASNNIQSMQGGTSIAQLRQKQQQNMINDNIQYNKNKINEQTQSLYSNNSINNNSINNNMNDDIMIDNLITDINTSFDDFSPSDEKEDNIINDIENEDDDEDEDDDDKYYKKILKILIEPVILLTIYLIMSQERIRNIIAKYIPQLNPVGDDCEIPFSGVFIYGVILTLLFSIIKIIVKQIMN
jgi:hypothetical protein